MKRTYHVFIFLNIFLLSLNVYSNEEVKLESVPGSKHKQGTIRHVLQASMDQVWETITDIEHYAEFMPSYKSSTILEKTPDKIRYHAYINMPWPIANVEYDCDIMPGKDRKRIDFQMVEGTGKGVKDFHGHWEFELVSENQISATYILLFEPTKNYPQWALNIGLKSTLGKVMKNVQKRINQQYKTSKL